MDWWLSSLNSKPKRHSDFSQAENNAEGAKNKLIDGSGLFYLPTKKHPTKQKSHVNAGWAAKSQS